MRGLRRPVPLVVIACAALALSGCVTASGAPPSPFGAVSPVPPAGEVTAVGTVLDTAGDAELCLGPVAESYPPQCTGVPLEGWTWEGVDGAESSGEVTWGAYAVQGTFDGESFTVTQPPVMLALYDPMAPEDPTGGEPGAGDDETLARIQEELPDRLGSSYLSSYPQDGRLWVDVVWDDGTWQDAADREFGADVVLIRSAMREAAG
ncbi:hypothetical protein [Microbacterium atlanticum]|uniref:hypothetical protein n=1 Tax=Microbacterium atlanticum TaxID=2782168 RepID=UPI001888E5B2|nr:hypothetical protein [Microbacterium atlanticum]